MPLAQETHRRWFLGKRLVKRAATKMKCNECRTEGTIGLSKSVTLCGLVTDSFFVAQFMMNEARDGTGLNLIGYAQDI